jgi:hypothetical protein
MIDRARAPKPGGQGVVGSNPATPTKKNNICSPKGEAAGKTLKNIRAPTRLSGSPDRERKQMAKRPLIALLQSKLDQARKELRAAVVDFDIPDDKLLELREAARQTFIELKEQDRVYERKGFLESLKFW